MENFIVSARKYRPATFDTVIGQTSITTTLKNAIKNNHLAQAFLFCGPRGVGKTTCARILAKTINCFHPTAEMEACNTCDSCVSFNNGQSLNVYELDAASNNSVEDIRSLVEQVRFAPQLGKFKVYIIDEVHMLSNSAFNAFLKTLEEPPSHAIFILATTEKHKIIPTILSRCQIFDFNRIQIEDISRHLAHIASKEGITAEPDALHIIAQKADGALRDACSIFDQIVSFAGNNVTYKAVIDNLNILDYDYYFKITDSILAEDIHSSLLTFNEILNNGFDGHNFITGLAAHFRNLLVCKDTSTLQLLEVGNNIKEKYKVQSSRCSLPFLLYGLNIASKCDINYKSSKNQRLLVELSLMQLCSAGKTNGSDEKKNDILKPAGSPAVAAKLVENIAAPIAKPVLQPTEPVEKSASSLTPNTAFDRMAGVPIKAEVVAEPPVSPINNQPKKPVLSKLGMLKTVGASTGVKEAEDVPEIDITYVRPDQAKDFFSKEQFLTVWNDYANQLKTEGKHSLHATLTKQPPVVNDNFEIELLIENKVQEDDIIKEKIEMLTYIRQKLNNFHIQLKTVITEMPDEKRLYTAQEKFRRMIELNPNILKLKQQLDLDVEM